MVEKRNTGALEVFRTKRISLAKFGLFLALMSSLTMVIFSLFNSGAQTLILGSLDGSISTTIITALIALGLCEFCAGILIIAYKKIKGTPGSEYKSLWNMKASRITLLSGLAAGPFATCSLMIAITLCGLTYANSLLSLAPMLVAILARIFFKEKPVLRVYIGIGIAVAGVIIASYARPEGVENFYLGILFACFAPIGFSIESMLSSRVMDVTDPLEVCGMYRCLGGGSFGVIISLLISVFLGKTDVFVNVFKIAFGNGIILLYLVITAAFIAVEYATIYLAYNYCGPSRGIAIVFSTPVWSIPIGFIMAPLFPYSVTALGIAGALISVVGMILIVLKPSELFSMREFK